MEKVYKYTGEEFLLDDANGCFIKVTYKDQVGCLALASRGTADNPYRWAGGSYAPPGGLRSETSSGRDVEQNLQGLCRSLIHQHRMVRANLDPHPARIGLTDQIPLPNKGFPSGFLAQS